ncbi:MAG: cation:proton antiporter [Gemmatimonadota bacterium]|jgi:Kef-type K+ transport system membrane component KefB|nr:cation:proton antiporter [Gemmatimonadota bacterium]
MIGIAILLAGAALGFGLARWSGLPSIPFLLGAGIVLSVAGLVPPPDVLENSLVLGLSFLVFVAGTEMNPRRVRNQRRAAIGVGIAQFVLLGTAGLAAALALGYPPHVALYLALALTASSTLVVVRLLQSRRQLFEPFGRLVIGVLLVQDLLIILLMPVIARLQDGPVRALLGLASALALVLLSYAALRWLTPLLIVRLKLDEETLLLVVLALLFLFIGAGNLLQLPVVAGAFLAGVSLSSFPASGLVRGQLSSLADFFTAIFFTALGALLVLPSAPELLRALVLAAVVILVTPPLVTIVAERFGVSARPALESGLLLAQASEFSLVVGLQGLVLGQIDSEVFTVIALITALTMTLTPFVATDRVTWRLLRFHPSRRQVSIKAPPRDHVLLLGCGENGMPLLETLTLAGHEVVVVDDDPAVIARLREGDVRCIRGDGSDLQVLRQAGAEHARVVISTVRRPLDNELLLRHARGVPVIARVFDPLEAERIRALGGTPILYSEAAAEDFLTWLDQAAEVGIEQERRARPRTL